MYFFALVLAFPALVVTATTMQQSDIVAGTESTALTGASSFDTPERSPAWAAQWTELKPLRLPPKDPAWVLGGEGAGNEDAL